MKKYALLDAQREYLESHPPGSAVYQALCSLLEIDSEILIIDANERSITFRFAMFLQSHFLGWSVDCEFNRDGIDPKKLAHMDLYPDSDDEEAKTVFPDVIVHRRGTRENLLAIEFKKSTSHIDRRIDLQKLHGYKRQLGYQYALFVEVGTGEQACVTALEWI